MGAIVLLLFGLDGGGAIGLTFESVADFIIAIGNQV